MKLQEILQVEESLSIPEQVNRGDLESIQSKIHERVRLVTAALPYINNVPHLGHMAGSHIPADIFARFSRMKGYNTKFIGGSDEHGTPSELAADSLGLNPEIFCDKLHEVHKQVYDWFDISYDYYGRTSEYRHSQIVESFFLGLLDNDFIAEREEHMFFDIEKDRFLPGRYVLGTCSNCASTNMPYDQCDNCGVLFNTDNFLDPVSTLSNSTPEIRSTKHLFIDLPLLQPVIEDWFKSKKDWNTLTRGITSSWLNQGLEQRSITRDLNRGVHVNYPGYEDKVFYVWFEAPIAYVSFSDSVGEIQEFWESNQSEVFHFLGKDNIPFHTIIWPSIIEGSNIGINKPEKVIGYSYLNYEGEKFSKSRNVGVFCDKLLESDFPVDVLRAYITLILPESSDANFNWEDLVSKINNEVIANFGNYINRVLSFLFKKKGGQLDSIQAEDFDDLDRNFIQDIFNLFLEIDADLEDCNFKKAFKGVLSLSSLGNKFFQDSKPWKFISENPDYVNRKLFLCVYLIKVLGIVSSPFIPETSNTIMKMLGKANSNWMDALDYSDISGIKIDKNPELLFKRLEDDFIESMKDSTEGHTNLASYFYE